MEIELYSIGTCVGSEIHGLKTWRGESITYWGVFDTDPKDVNLPELRKHLIKAYSIESLKPKGGIRVHSFIKQN